MTIKKQNETNLNIKEIEEAIDKIKKIERFINSEYEKKYFWRNKQDSCTIYCEDNTFKDGYQLALSAIGSLMGMNLEVSEKRNEEFIIKENEELKKEIELLKMKLNNQKY